MTLRDRLRDLRNITTPKGWAMVAVLALLLVLLGALQVKGCMDDRTDALKARTDRTLAEGDTAAAANAVKATADLAERTQERNDLTRSNQDDILNAEGAALPHAPNVYDAGIRARCLRDAYRDDPRCVRLREAGSGDNPG